MSRTPFLLAAQWLTDASWSEKQLFPRHWVPRMMSSFRQDSLLTHKGVALWDWSIPVSVQHSSDILDSVLLLSALIQVAEDRADD